MNDTAAVREAPIAFDAARETLTIDIGPGQAGDRAFRAPPAPRVIVAGRDTRETRETRETLDLARVASDAGARVIAMRTPEDSDADADADADASGASGASGAGTDGVLLYRKGPPPRGRSQALDRLIPLLEMMGWCGSVRGPRFTPAPAPAPRKCSLPECRALTLHRGGYCCAEHRREHVLRLRQRQDQTRRRG